MVFSSSGDIDLFVWLCVVSGIYGADLTISYHGVIVVRVNANVHKMVILALVVGDFVLMFICFSIEFLFKQFLVVIWRCNGFIFCDALECVCYEC